MPWLNLDYIGPDNMRLLELKIHYFVAAVPAVKKMLDDGKPLYLSIFS